MGTESDKISSDLYFSIVPEWIIDLPVSAQAVRLYAVLSRYADKEDNTCYPSIKTIAKRMHTSDSTVKRALRELKEHKAVHVEQRYNPATKEQTSNLYTLIRIPPFMYELPQVNDDLQGSSHEDYKLKSYNHSNKGKHYELYEALCEVMGYVPSTKTEQNGWNKVAKELKESLATVDEVYERAETYQRLWKDVTFTPYALVKHWSRLGKMYEDNKPPVPRDCTVQGHVMIDLDVIKKCQFCGHEVTVKK